MFTWSTDPFGPVIYPLDAKREEMGIFVSMLIAFPYSFGKNEGFFHLS